MSAGASNGRLALRDAILAGYQYLTKTYAPNYANAELVRTRRDGQRARRHVAQLPAP